MTNTHRDSTQPERLLGELDLDEHLRNPGMKQRFVTTMFEVIAPRYDRFTRVFSYGMDRGWKREVLAEVTSSLPPTALVIDLACGTGDLAMRAAWRLPQGCVTGVDISRRMVSAAEERRRQLNVERVRFYVGDMLHLCARDGSVDAVIAGYAIRNAPVLASALDEIARVLKPGGRLVTLDFFKPRNPVWRKLFLGYLGLAGNFIGWLWHRQPVAYGYIARSIEHFVSWQEFCRTLEARGFAVQGVRRKLLGGICIHIARKNHGRPHAG